MRIKAPTAGAGSANVIVPVAAVPPLTDGGVIVKLVNVGRFPLPPETVKDPCAVTPPACAVTVFTAGVNTGTVNTVKLTEVCPAGIITVGGTP